MLNLFDWVIKNVTDRNPPIDRLIILGDLFDFWTYPPDQRPPTIEQIRDANPCLLGSNGKMREVVDALHGNVLYIHGNHDINISQADLDLIPTGGNKIKLVDDIYFGSDGVVYTHGHLFTMFNAPDLRFPGDVPVGHFVTRAIAYHVNNTLGVGETAASLHEQGSPSGPDLSGVISALTGQLGNPSITDALLSDIATWAGLPEDHPIVMANGSVTSIAEVKAKYDGLWTSWVAQNGGGKLGEEVAAKAVQADRDGTYLPWFAQRIAMQLGARGILTGHTHKPKSGLQNSMIQYVNCGFECPSTRDTASGCSSFNFAIVDSRSNLQLWQVTETGEIEPAERVATDQVVYSPLMDYSCYVRIVNNTGNDLTKQTQEAQHGNYVVPPPDRIPANATVDIWLQDSLGAFGAEGSVTYSHPDGSSRMTFTFGCPTVFSNYASGGAWFIAASDDPLVGNEVHNQVPSGGHPLFVQFSAACGSGGVYMTETSLRQFLIRIGADPAQGVRRLVRDIPNGSVRTLISSSLGHPLPWTPTSLLAQAVSAAGFLYDPGQDIIYSKMDPLQRQFGYSYGYDVAALGIDGILDCEPIFFDYAGKHWMIELWKGQYGLETGCEIGVYNRPIGSSSPKYRLLDETVGRRPGDPISSHNLYFDCANDSELLEMSCTLYKNCERLMSRGPEKHWWLTGFKWGVYSHPDELAMDVSITCLDAAMCSALVGALQGMGYNFTISSTTVRFRFTTPATHQPRSDTPALVQAAELVDQRNVNTYNAFGFRNNDPNTIPDSARDTIMNAVGIYSVEFFAQTIANLAKSRGLSVHDLIDGLAQAFNIGIDLATDLAAQAGYVFSDWVSEVENVLGIDLKLDFSCYVEISNRGGQYDLILEDQHINQGNYVVRPPDRITAGRIARFWLKDPKPRPFGADGWVKYYYIDSANNRHSIAFTYACPTGLASNIATNSAPFNFYTKSGDINSSWSRINQVVTRGHPLVIAYVYGSASPPS